jgi:TPP-dependent 2-oxoacid decarboxylase
MPTTETTIGEYLIHKLYAHGVRHVFGIPGDYVLSFFKQLEQSELKTINTCDEQGAGFAADAYARVRGMGVVCITYGVGGLKVANSTAQAYAEESPVVIISGAPGMEERKGNPLLHHKAKTFETQLRVFEQLTVATAVLDNPETACAEIDRVLGAAICYRRPVYIELPRDMVPKKVTHVEEPLRLPEMDRRPLQEALQEAEAMINAARQPVFITGVELLRYGLQNSLLQLAEKTNIPVAGTILSKSTIDECHPLYLGVYEGAVSQERVRAYVENSDCVILLGTFLTDITLGIFTAHLDQGKSIHSTSEKTSIRYHTYHGVYLGSFIRELLKTNLKRREAPVTPSSAERSAMPAPTNQPITIERLFQQLGEMLDGNLFVISDTGDALFGATDMAIPRPTEFMASAYYASLGFAVPASLGVQLALPKLRPLVLVGDGAFQMTGMELTTAARYHLNPIVIVLNNYGYGTERPMLDGRFNDVYPWQTRYIPKVLNAGLSFDVYTEEEFDKALRAARAHTESFCIVEVHLDAKDFSPALLRMTSALGKRVTGVQPAAVTASP